MPAISESTLVCIISWSRQRGRIQLALSPGKHCCASFPGARAEITANTGHEFLFRDALSTNFPGQLYFTSSIHVARLISRSSAYRHGMRRATERGRDPLMDVSIFRRSLFNRSIRWSSEIKSKNLFEQRPPNPAFPATRRYAVTLLPARGHPSTA